MIRTTSKLSILFAVLAVAAGANVASAQKVALRWKYVPGSEVVYRVSSRQNMEVAAMGGTSTSEQIQTLRWRVADVAANGDATIHVMTERVQLDMSGLAGDVHYDSETGAVPDQPQVRILAAMAGLGYTMVIGADGVVQSVEGMDQVRDRIFEAMPEQAALVQSLSGDLFSDEAMARMMQQSVQLFPREPVGPSDTWRHSFSMAVPMLGTMTTNMTFTLTGIEQREGRTVAVISTDGDMVVGADSTSQLPVAFDMSETKMTGTIDFDVDRGLTLASRMSMTMQMTMGAGGQEMAMKSTQTTNVELVEYLPGR